MIPQDIKKNLSKAYDRQSKQRNQSRTQDWKIKERGAFLEKLKNEKKHSLLEIGSGPGKDSLFFSQEGFNVQATDLSEDMVQLCREKGLKADVMSFDDLQFPESSFDAVWALNCLLHVPKENLPEILRGIRSVLKKDGLFYLGVYGGINHEGIWQKDFHEPKRFFSFYEDEILESILKREFKLEAFHKIPIEEGEDGPTHFQGVILRK
ncbi:class I SAM-dependent methyltransferase [Halobacillus sp. HZG1]|uniref:class I SAM-dependent methyltransferase n=1 Tax=Halobacillus TaxID=45667 RepID=UPI001925EF62|nr:MULTISPECIES: class I SAM-dependent methyltransferase [Halobacillus]MEC3883525.1 class I SAM-dependent methyltransferase [Halobacillus sp. HZG1]